VHVVSTLAVTIRAGLVAFHENAVSGAQIPFVVLD
jgi:hypothetical protein